MIPEAVLGPALAEAVRTLVREELARSASAPATSAVPERRPVTVPRAAEATGLSEETIRELIHAKRIPERLVGANPNPKRRTFLVYVDEVLAALERRPDGAEAEPVDFQMRAAQLRARAEKRGG